MEEIIKDIIINDLNLEYDRFKISKNIINIYKDGLVCSYTKDAIIKILKEKR